MDPEEEIWGIIDDLRSIVLDNTDFPNAKTIKDRRLSKAILEFEKKFAPKRKKRITITTVKSFIKRHGIFDIVESDLGVISDTKSRVIFLEGPDASGKTVLAEKLGKMTRGIGIEHQSAALFRMMFKMPKVYKTVVVDYNRNPYVGFLFYVVDNLLGLRQAAEYAAAGKKTIILDSSFLRTVASRMANPLDSRRRPKMDMALYNLVKRDYSKRYVNLLSQANGSLLVAFMYISEKARLDQAEKRGNADDYDTNSAYSRLVTGLMRKEEHILKKKGINAISMMMLEKGERNRTGKGADFFFIRTSNFSNDIRKKAELLLSKI